MRVRYLAVLISLVGCSGSTTLPNLCSPDGGTFCTSTDCYSPSVCTGSCTGDAGAWAAILALPLTCTQNSDCCVVVNTCTNQAQLVPASAYATAPGTWPSCQNQCTGCIPPAVTVACVSGQCVGQTSSGAAGMSSCGSGDAGLATPSTSSSFSCGG